MKKKSKLKFNPSYRLDSPVILEELGINTKKTSKVKGKDLMKMGLVLDRKCGKCGTNRRLSLCAGCGKAYYCGKICQRQDWRSHKPVCKSLKNGSSLEDQLQNLIILAETDHVNYRIRSEFKRWRQCMDIVKKMENIINSNTNSNKYSMLIKMYKHQILVNLTGVTYSLKKYKLVIKYYEMMDLRVYERSAEEQKLNEALFRLETGIALSYGVTGNCSQGIMMLKHLCRLYETDHSKLNTLETSWKLAYAYDFLAIVHFLNNESRKCVHFLNKALEIIIEPMTTGGDASDKAMLWFFYILWDIVAQHFHESDYPKALHSINMFKQTLKDLNENLPEEKKSFSPHFMFAEACLLFMLKSKTSELKNSIKRFRTLFAKKEVAKVLCENILLYQDMKKIIKELKEIVGKRISVGKRRNLKEKMKKIIYFSILLHRDKNEPLKEMMLLVRMK